MVFIRSTLESLISYFHFSFHHWGLAIFALALVIRLALLPLQVFQFKQQRLLARIQPELDHLKIVHEKDPLEFFKAVGEVKKKEGVKSGWSLLASLVQIPIFISIYRVFSSMQSLMGGSFSWLSSLGTPDPLFVFPALVALTSFLQQRLNPPPASAENATMVSVMKLMPVLSMVFMVTMPSGLVMYYAASGVLQLAGDYALRKMWA